MVTKAGALIDPPDTGTGLSRILATVLTILFVVAVIFWQNAPVNLKQTLTNAPPQSAVEQTADDPAPGAFAQTDITARIYIKMRHLIFKRQPEAAKSIMVNIDPIVTSNEDHIRAAILAAEFEGADNALARLDTLEGNIIENTDASEIDPLITRDIAILQTLYAQEHQTLDQADQDYLVNRYSKLGKVALTFGLDDDDPARKPLITGAAWVLVMVLLVLFALTVVPLVGTVLLIMAAISLATGKMKLAAHKPARGGSVFLETYGFFILAFLVIAVVGQYIEDRENLHALGVFIIPLQWALLGTVFWGVLRGMNFTRWRHAIGLHSGKGIFREIGCGIVGYIAAVPLFLLGTLVTIILLFFQGALNLGSASDEQLPANPFFDIMASGDLVSILLLFTLATIWAPLCEELIFRGALFRHFSGYVHWSIAALGTAILFAFMHSYGPIFVTPLIALGFSFAFMRQWRGSLIAAITAHFIHNFSLLSFVYFFVWVLTT